MHRHIEFRYPIQLFTIFSLSTSSIKYYYIHYEYENNDHYSYRDYN